MLINNAGITNDQMFHKMTEEQWNSVILTNLFALFNITQPIYTQMRANAFGRILNISSVNALKGQMGQVNYCASKAGVIGFTKALSLEGARFGVTVNTISPGYTETDMVEAIAPEIREKIEASIPLGRFSRPEEIACLVAYVLSDEASYISGANFNINGALHLA
jgi:acetoacetyl-CoA reductase